MIDRIELFTLLMSRTGNDWMLDGKQKAVAFYSVYPTYIELYLVDPHDLARGVTLFALSDTDCIRMLKDPVGHVAWQPKMADKIKVLELRVRTVRW